MEKQNKRVNKITTTHSIYLEFILHYIYQNYILLYCKGHIQMTSNYNNLNVVTKSYTLNKITTTHSIYLEFILGYSYKMLKIYLKNKPGKKIQPSMSYYKQLRLTTFIADIQISCYRMHFNEIR